MNSLHSLITLAGLSILGLTEPSPELQQLIPGVTSTAALALRFVLANTGTSTAFSNIASTEKATDNASTIEAAPELTDAERACFYAVIRQFETPGEQFCTGCSNCLPCPKGVDIPACFRQYNIDTVYGVKAHAHGAYLKLPKNQRASACIHCGECEARCPSHLPIMEQLEQVRTRFESPQA